MGDEIICDKCGSHSVVQKSATPPPLPNKKPVKMSEWLKHPPNRYEGQIVNAVLTYHTYVLYCQNCGHTSKEFTY